MKVQCDKILKATGTYLQDKLYSNVDVNYSERETWKIFPKVMNSLFIQVIYVHFFALSASAEASAKDGDAAEVLTQYWKISF